mmetsp:Transcript_1059/g.4358  ORF Transcript_1059/g.4358 Transcript_1059/m.4358 type:complete len:365 (+) Transcript_1059:368-1462(+)
MAGSWAPQQTSRHSDGISMAAKPHNVRAMSLSPKDSSKKAMASRWHNPRKVSESQSEPALNQTHGSLPRTCWSTNANSNGRRLFSDQAQCKSRSSFRLPRGAPNKAAKLTKGSQGGTALASTAASGDERTSSSSLTAPRGGEAAKAQKGAAAKASEGGPRPGGVGCTWLGTVAGARPWARAAREPRSSRTATQGASGRKAARSTASSAWPSKQTPPAPSTARAVGHEPHSLRAQAAAASSPPLASAPAPHQRRATEAEAKRAAQGSCCEGPKSASDTLCPPSAVTRTKAMSPASRRTAEEVAARTRRSQGAAEESPSAAAMSHRARNVRSRARHCNLGPWAAPPKGQGASASSSMKGPADSPRS